MICLSKFNIEFEFDIEREGKKGEELKRNKVEKRTRREMEMFELKKKKRRKKKSWICFVCLMLGIGEERKQARKEGREEGRKKKECWANKCQKTKQNGRKRSD